MSLNTLLEAAKFLELQELQEHVQATITKNKHIVSPSGSSSPPPLPPPPLPPPPPPSQTACSPVVITHINPQTVVITAANLATNIVNGPIALTTSNTTKKESIDPTVNSRHLYLHNSFDIRNPLVIDETNESKRKQPPLVFRAGTREVHNKLEKHRRAHLKECFDYLKKQLPATSEEKKTSNLSILHAAIRYIQSLRRKERELEHEMEHLAREKISAQNKLAILKKDLSMTYEHIDFTKLLPDSSTANLSKSDLKLNEVKAESAEIKSKESYTSQVIKSIGSERISSIPETVNKSYLPVTSTCSLKEVQQPVQGTLSVLPVGYPINQGLVLPKLAIVPKSLTDLTPLVPTFLPPQLNGKVVPLVNTQYVVKPLVVVSTASPRSS